MPNRRRIAGPTERSLEVTGFYQGTQDVPADFTVAEIEATWEQIRQLEIESSAEIVATLAGQVSTLERESGRIAGICATLEDRSPTSPPVVMPLLACMVAVLAAAGEIILLVPVTDGLVAAVTEEYLTALSLMFVTVVGFAVLVHQFFHRGSRDKTPTRRRIELLAVVVVSVGSLLLAGTLGLWRAQKLAFDATIDPSIFGRFANDHLEITSLLLTLLTVFFPLFGTIATDWGLSALRFWRHWRRGMRRRRHLEVALDKATAKLESSRETCAARLASIDERAEAAMAIFLEHHELGRRIGAHQDPFWKFVTRVVAFTAASLTLSCLVIASPLAAFFVSPGMAVIAAIGTTIFSSLAYASFAYKRWSRPSPCQIFRERAVKFRNVDDGVGRGAARERVAVSDSASSSPGLRAVGTSRESRSEGRTTESQRRRD